MEKKWPRIGGVTVLYDRLSQNRGHSRLRSCVIWTLLAPPASFVPGGIVPPPHPQPPHCSRALLLPSLPLCLGCPTSSSHIWSLSSFPSQFRCPQRGLHCPPSNMSCPLPPRLVLFHNSSPSLRSLCLFFIYSCLFGCARTSLRHVGSSFLTRGRTQAPYMGREKS